MCVQDNGALIGNEKKYKKPERFKQATIYL